MARAAHWNRVYTTKGPTDVSWFEPRGIPTWIEADATGEWTSGRMQLWHDRAVFHFLTQPDDRARYRQHLLDTLEPGGSAIIATFARTGQRPAAACPSSGIRPTRSRVNSGTRSCWRTPAPTSTRPPGAAPSRFSTRACGGAGLPSRAMGISPRRHRPGIGEFRR